MGFSVNSNISAQYATLHLTFHQEALGDSLLRLSSGVRINRAADDASGMAIADALRSQALGLGQAMANANDGISMMQIADNAMGEQVDILMAIRTKAIQAAHDGHSAASRQALQDEVVRLLESLDSITQTTSYNAHKLLTGTFRDKSIQIGAYSNQTVSFSIGSTASDVIGATRFEAIGNIHESGFVRLVLDGVTLETVEIAEREGTGVGVLADLINRNSDLLGGIEADYAVVTTASQAVAAGDLAGLTINGVLIGDITGVQANDADGTLVGAINARTDETGVIADIDERGHLSLSSVDGRGIVVETGEGGTTSEKTVETTVETITDTTVETVTETTTDGTTNTTTDTTSSSATDTDTTTTTTPSSDPPSGPTTVATTDTTTSSTSDSTTTTTSTTTPHSDSSGVLGASYDFNIGKSGVIENVSLQWPAVGLIPLVSFTGSGPYDLNNGGGSTLAADITAATPYTASYDSGSGLLNVTKPLASVVGSWDHISTTTTTVTTTTTTDVTTNTTTTTTVVDTGTTTPSSGIMNIDPEDLENYGMLYLSREGAGDITVSEIYGDSVLDDALSRVSEASVALADITQSLSSETARAMGFFPNENVIGYGEAQPFGLLSFEGAMMTIRIADAAIGELNRIRSDIGSVQKQLESTVNNLATTYVNIRDAQSRIHDLDFAAESAHFSKENLLSKAGTFALAQATATRKTILTLLQ